MGPSDSGGVRSESVANLPRELNGAIDSVFADECIHGGISDEGEVGEQFMFEGRYADPDHLRLGLRARLRLGHVHLFPLNGVIGCRPRSRLVDEIMLNEPDEVVKRSRLRDVIAARLHDYRVDRLGARKQEAISLEILEATGVKIGSSSVGEYERPGSARIPADYIAAFCQTYGVEPRYLLLGEGPIDADPSSSGRSIIEGFLREQLAQYRGSIPEDPGEEEAT